MPKDKAQQRTKSKRLLVEGKVDKFLIPHVMDHFVIWGEKPEDWVVDITAFGGDQLLMAEGVIGAELKQSGLQALGIVVDADDGPDRRWGAVVERCRNAIPDFPKDLPDYGLIHVTASGLRVGVWIMPDNRSTGMLETFLAQLVPADRASLWDFAQRSRQEARTYGATYRDVHRDKADIHTYLAWLDPPGQQLNEAVKKESLDARTPLGLRFAKWFVDLFDLTTKDAGVFGG